LKDGTDRPVHTGMQTINKQVGGWNSMVCPLFNTLLEAWAFSSIKQSRDMLKYAGT